MSDDVVFVGHNPGDFVIHAPPTFAPADAYEKFRIKTIGSRHILGAPLVDGLDGVQPVQHGYRQLHEQGTLYLKQGSQSVPFALNGDLDAAYDRLGNTRSFLGFPVADFLLDPDDAGACVAYFENGYMFYWPDVGAVAIRELAIKFTGFHVFGQTDEPSPSDEPYFINGVLPMDAAPVSSMTRIYEGTGAGRSVSDDVLMYEGPPQALTVTITLLEHDQGDPNTYKALVDKALDKGAEAAAAAIATIPAVGAPLSVVGQIAYAIAGPSLKQSVNDLLGTADDLVASTTLSYAVKDVLRLASEAGAGGNTGRVETPLLSGDGASYKAYFDFVIRQA
jgi:LGFP repeat